MTLGEGPIRPVSSVLFASLLPSGPNTVSITTSQRNVLSLLVAPQPKVSSVPTSSCSLVTASAVPSRTASLSDFF